MSYKVVKSDPLIHKQILLDLWKESLPVLSVERFSWFYNDNPAGQPQTWLVQDQKKERYVGCCSIYPREIFINGQSQRAGVASDFAINRKHRVLGPAVLLQRAVCDNFAQLGFDFVLAWPNKSSEPVFKRVEYKKLGETQRWVKLLRVNEKLNQVVKHEIVSSVIGALVNPVLNLYNKILYLTWCRGHSWRVVSSLQNLETKMQALWDKSSLPQQYNSCYRSADYLQWRYLNNPVKRIEILVLESKKDGSVAGYCAFSFEEATGFIEIIDSFALSSELMISVWVALVGFAKTKKVTTISVTLIAGVKICNLMKKIGFIPRERIRKVLLKQNAGQSADTTLYPSESWLIFDGDLDV